MKRSIVALAVASVAMLSSCAKKESAEQSKPAVETAQSSQPASGPHAVVHLQDGSKVPGAIVASTQTDMTVAGDDGIERKIPLTQVKSVDYNEAAAPPQQVSSARPEPAAKKESPSTAVKEPLSATGPAPARRAAPSTTYELPAASEISVRTNETIDSAKAAEGQTFDAQVTRDSRDASGNVVIPRGAPARIVIRSASKGGRFRGASDLVLDLKSVTIDGRSYAVDTADLAQKGKSGIGTNKRTAEYTGGGAALGAIIGAIAGGGKGAAIGAGAGAGAGAVTQVITKGGAIRVPVETVLTFRLDRPLRVTAVE